jgi:uncharacterized protein YjiS (DUF1127 family)
MTRSVLPAPKATTFTLALARIALRAVSQTVAALKNRRQIARLADLDDRALKDIGLIRSDIDAALALPMNRDPSQHLQDVSGHGASGYQAGASLKTPELSRLRHHGATVAPSGLRIAGI